MCAFPKCIKADMYKIPEVMFRQENIESNFEDSDDDFVPESRVGFPDVDNDEDDER